MVRFKSEHIKILPVNPVLIAVFYQIPLVIGDSIFLGGFKLGCDVLDMSVVDAKNSRCIADGYFILDDGN